MSVTVMSWAWEHSAASGRDLLVLLAIADRADDEGCNAWPSQSTLAKKTRISIRSVQRAINNLVDIGELAVDVHSGGGQHVEDRYRPNRYRVVMKQGRQSVTSPDGRGDNGDAKGRQDGQSGATLLSPNTSLIHPEPSASQGASSVTCGMCDDIGWLEKDAGMVRCPQCGTPKRRLRGVS